MASDKDSSNGPLVSVVMPTYRMGAFIGDALRSIGDQTHTVWEVLVVDDHGPEDGTHEHVRAFAEHFPDRVELIVHPENKGVSAARNTGALQARGEYLAFFDPDDLWLPDHLSKLLAKFSMAENVDVVAGPVLIVRESVAPRVSAMQGWQQRYFPHTLALYNFIQPSASLLRADAFRRVGGFDTDPLIQHIEDYDLWIRLVTSGSRFSFLKEPTSHYRQHAGGATSDEARMNRLDAYLRAKHATFFAGSQAQLVRNLLAEVQGLKTELQATQAITSGPMFRSLAGVDRLLRGIKRKFIG